MSAVLIADCGATTCQYALLDAKSGELVTQSNIRGYNPHSSATRDFPIFNVDPATIDEIHFYVAGYKPALHGELRGRLHEQFPQGTIHVNSDLKAAALSLCPESPAYVHVIGTGSAVNFWNGRAFTNPKLNLGYLWEDFASGYDLGKTMVKWWSEGRLSEQETDIMERKLGNLGTFVQKVYQNNPKLILAEAAPIIHALSASTRSKIVEERLELYFQNNVDIFKDEAVHHFNGSLAMVFEQVITRKMEERDVSLGIIQRDSMEGLISYYQHKITKS